ncbi:hypothetical protein OKW35_003461 [Paraburkholderia sp. MM5477-R1]
MSARARSRMAADGRFGTRRQDSTRSVKFYKTMFVITILANHSKPNGCHETPASLRATGRKIQRVVQTCPSGTVTANWTGRRDPIERNGSGGLPDRQPSSCSRRASPVAHHETIEQARGKDFAKRVDITRKVSPDHETIASFICRDVRPPPIPAVSGSPVQGVIPSNWRARANEALVCLCT